MSFVVDCVACPRFVLATSCLCSGVVGVVVFAGRHGNNDALRKVGSTPSNLP